MEIDAWLAPFRRYWSVHVDALERHLDRMNQVPRRKGRKTMSSRENYEPGPAAGAEIRRRGRSGRSFSSENCATRRKKSGRR